MKNTNKVIVLAGLASVLLFASALMIPINVDAASASCQQNASKSCISNISYWYDSCGNIQSVNQNCNLTNQTCSNGMCVNKTGVNYSTGNTGNTGTTNNNDINYNQTNYPVAGYIQNYRTGCFNNNVQWYDSRGSVQGIYQNCQDANSCTVDTCQDNACKSQLKCDGSTCMPNSADYITYCQNNVQGQATATTNGNVQVVGQVAGTMTQQSMLAVSLFGKKQSNNTSWTKSVDAGNNEKMEFLMVIKNASPMPVNAVNATVDLTGAITYTGNLTVDGTTSAGSLASGIDLGMFPANTSKIIHFTATAQSSTSQTVQVIARTTANGATDADAFTANITSATATASSSPFLEFIKRWYLWIIIVIVLIALFVIIFRRLSTNP